MSRYELKPNSKSRDVVALKRLLYDMSDVRRAVPRMTHAWSYREEYDSMLCAAVKELQRLERLPTTGEMDAKTWAALRTRLDRIQPGKAKYAITFYPELGELLQGTVTATTRGGDPNCMLNAVEGATGLARVFGNVRPGGTYVGHDGVHVVAPIGSKLKTLPVLAGKVIDRHDQGDGTSALDVLVNGGKHVVIYKDIKVSPAILRSLQRKQPHTLKAGDVIGTVASGGEKMGVHITLLRGGQREHDYYRGLTRRIYALAEARGKAMDKVYANKANPTLEAKYREEAERLGREKFDTENKIKAELFVDPLSSESPIKCPGAEADPAAVIPYRK